MDKHIFGVVGKPILHSASPALFTEAYEGAMPYLFIIADNASEARQLFDDLEMRGMNVTAPFKPAEQWGEGVKSLAVEEIGMLNTLVRDENGEVSFHNTDPSGVIYALGDYPLREAQVLVLGAGGAAQIATYILEQKGACVTVANRTVREGMISLAEATTRASEYNIIVNTLNVEVVKKVNKEQIFIDAIYHNSPYSYLSGEANYRSGMLWLEGQALAAYKLFGCEEPDVKAMRDVETIKPCAFTFLGARASLLGDEVSSKDGLRVWLYEKGDTPQELLAAKAQALMCVTHIPDDELLNYVKLVLMR